MSALPLAALGDVMGGNGSVVKELKAVIAKRSVLNHPFYQMWQHGKLDAEMVRDYARQYYPHVLAFPTYLSAVHANCSDLAVRQQILENLIEEERGPENHPELWLRFTDALGLRRSAVKAAQPLPSTERFIRTFQRVTREASYPAGLAALYAYESQIPEVSRVKIEGLRRFYGVNDRRGLSFFTAHMGLDEIHSEVEARLIAKHAGDEATRDDVVAAGRKAADAYWGFLDGVLEAHVLRAG